MRDRNQAIRNGNSDKRMRNRNNHVQG